jgi:phage baseplate assembly protein W
MASTSLKTFEDTIKAQSDTIFDFKDYFNPSGDFKRVSGINALISSLQNLLVTPLGSYPWDPTYGSLLYKKVWELLDEYSEEEIRREILDRTREFDDRIEIESVIINMFSDQKGFQVNMKIEYENSIEEVDLTIHQDDGIGMSTE